MSEVSTSISTISNDGKHSISDHSNDSKKRPDSWWTRVSLDTWVWELSAAFLCIGILAAIVGVLIAYDNRPAPTLPDGITVSAAAPYPKTY
jgi:hypothetical protein